MSHRILGLHHVTATVDQAQPDLDFCVEALGLRLVKKTVNFDNHHVYHFYYGDEVGRPGTLWTTFPYHGRGVRVGTKGAGQITATSFSVPYGSLEFWIHRFRERGFAVSHAEQFGESRLTVTDPSGLLVELVATRDDSRDGWDGAGVPRAQALRGLHSVTMLIRSPAATIGWLTDMLGFEQVSEDAGRVRLAVNGGGPGRLLEIAAAPEDAPAAVNGLGTVHHVALAIATAGEQLALREDLIRRGYRVTEVLDRLYFQSIYFREPGGVLLEVATVEPGFTVDESPESLGRALKLPAWQEPNRAEIEAGLAPVTHR